ncbi:hypothetical protein PIB30_056385 [Stylosanthes scabra]|uniref:peptidylprolyl isomerase n=1 Tax=Stylosanthes scabra TaxID=79078 RepID=A0ABU6UIR1_9FABA|nr:hypothetical protein [Stylosanthes scabra]
MELCSRTLTTLLHRTYPSPSSSSSSSNSLLRATTCNYATPSKSTNYFNLSSSQFHYHYHNHHVLHHFQQQPYLFHHHQSSSSSFKVSASSSSVAASSKEELDRLPAELNVTETQEPNSRVRLQVEVPPVVCEDCYKRVIAEFTKQAKVPGFRPGKPVPESILLGYVGRDNVQKATIESILRRTLPHAMTSVTGKALPDSVRIVSKFSDLEKIYSSQGSLRYDVLADIVPELKWVPDNAYKNLKIVVEIDSDIDAQKAAEQEFKRRYKSIGALKVVADRGLQVGDVVVIDISATTIDQDESKIKNIPSAESKGFNFDTEDGDRILPGFLDSIIGIRPGETKSFPLVFPETWNQENLRGVHAQFTVECKELFYRDLPELDDSIADKLVPGCTTVQQVKDLLLQRCQEVEQSAREQATDNAILDQISKAKMNLNDQQLASLSSSKAVNEYLEHQKDNIKNLIKQNLAVGDIYRRENLQFSTEDLVKEVENSISEFKRQNQEYDEDRVKDQVQEILEGAKVLEWLREHAEIQYVTR